MLTKNSKAKACLFKILATSTPAINRKKDHHRSRYYSRQYINDAEVCKTPKPKLLLC